MPSKDSRERVNLRLPSRLVRWARKHAKEHGQSFTAVVEEALQGAMDDDVGAPARRVLKTGELNASDV